MKLRTLVTTLAGVLVLLLAAPVGAQTTIDSTTFSTSITSTSLAQVSITSATCTGGCTFGKDFVIYADSEAMVVTAQFVSGTTNIPVIRGSMGTQATFHGTNNKIFIGPQNRFKTQDPPQGMCRRSDQQFMPWINVETGWVWTCDNGNTQYDPKQNWYASVPYITNQNSRFLSETLPWQGAPGLWARLVAAFTW